MPRGIGDLRLPAVDRHQQGREEQEIGEKCEAECDRHHEAERPADLEPRGSEHQEAERQDRRGGPQRPADAAKCAAHSVGRIEPLGPELVAFVELPDPVVAELVARNPGCQRAVETPGLLLAFGICRRAGQHIRSSLPGSVGSCPRAIRLRSLYWRALRLRPSTNRRRAL